MKRFMNLRGAAYAVGLLMGLAGCENNSGGPSVSPNPKKEAATKTSDSTEEASGRFHDVLAKLSAEDVPKATAQKICPVSEELLGSMGVPPKVDVNGQPVWICCESCRKKLLAEPDRYLMKIQPE